MSKVQEQLEEFHREVMGDLPEPKDPIEIRDGMLRAKLIMEEASETANALTGMEVRCNIGGHHLIANDCFHPNLVEVIDGCCDILVVTYGTAVRANFDLDPFMDEVHRTNMAKKGGPIRKDGKRLKPPGWTPPDIEGVLQNELLHRDRVGL